MLQLISEESLPLARPEALELARAENEPALRALLNHENPDVGEAACQILGLIGSEDSVEALLTHLRSGGASHSLKALLECGPAGRQSLFQLCLESGEVGELAMETLVEGLRRPPYRGAILGLLRQLVSSPKANQSIRNSAARNLTLCMWKSAGGDLEQMARGGPYAEILSEFLFPPVFPTPQSAAQALPEPYFAELNFQIDQQIAAAGRRAHEGVLRYREELDRRQSLRSETPASAGRNEACPCGSGKKFKKCCLAKSQALQRQDPWCQAYEQWPWNPRGHLIDLPMERADSARLLAIISEQKPARLRVRPEDEAVAAWVIASRLLELKDWSHVVPAIRQALLEREPVGLDTDLIMTDLVTRLDQSEPPEYTELLLDLFLHHGRECHLQLAGEMLLSHSDQVLSRLDGLLNRGLPLSKVMAFADGILKKMAFAELGEELAEIVPAFYPDDPTAQQALKELCERAEDEVEEEVPFPEPHPTVESVLAIENFAQKCWMGELGEKANDLSAMLRWPASLLDCSPDSHSAILDELETRRAQQAQLAREVRALAQEIQGQSLEHVVSAGRPLLCLAPARVLWFVPYCISAEQVSQSLAVAETLAVVSGWDRASVVGFSSGAALSWAEPGTDDLTTLANEASDQWQTERPGVVVLPLGCPQTCEALDWNGQSLLELGAEDGRFHRVRVSPPEVVQPDSRPATALESDPRPARKALRRVLRRLFRSNKVGEAHTAVELVSRGVRGHLRGQVNQCIDFLLQRGILRNKPTLKGLHTSIEPKYLPAVTRFIENGIPPLPELEALLS